MNVKLRNGFLALVLIPICFFNIGQGLFHDCNNLIHAHDENSIEIGHERCLICEFNIQPATEMLVPASKFISNIYFSAYKPLEIKVVTQMIESAANKGPPASV